MCKIPLKPVLGQSITRAIADRTTLAYTDREGETIAEILQAYRQLILISTDRITNKASVGQAAHNSMAMQLETQRLVRTLLGLRAAHPSETGPLKLIPHSRSKALRTCTL